MDNLTLLADFYEFTMANGYVEKGRKDEIAYFEYFFRKVPDDGGYAIFAGLEQFIDYIKNLKFNQEDIEFFRKKGIFSEEFLSLLKDFEFKCDVWAMEEGEIIFPSEPIVIVRGPLYQVQMIETMLLLNLNHQSLIATKANRICKVAEGRPVYEFGSRRAMGSDAANFGARAAFIGGVDGTANTIVERYFDIPAVGTMAHSWVQSFENEYESFKAYCEVYPDNASLLVDTYDVLRSGVPNAIRAFDEVLKPMGKRPKSIRLDSGDISYLSKQARKMLDDAGYNDVKIMASNSLDEYKIRDLLNHGAQIDSFGVGERLISAKSDPVFGGVYKLVALEDDKGNIIPKIKISEDVSKITNPGFKQVYRIYDSKTNYMKADLITTFDEVIDESKELEIFHPLYIWKRTTLKNFYTRKLLKEIFKEGKLVYDLPSIFEIREKTKINLSTLWEELTRLDDPHSYYVDLSEKLYKIRIDLLKGRNK